MIRVQIFKNYGHATKEMTQEFTCENLNELDTTMTNSGFSIDGESDFLNTFKKGTTWAIAKKVKYTLFVVENWGQCEEETTDEIEAETETEVRAYLKYELGSYGLHDVGGGVADCVIYESYDKENKVVMVDTVEVSSDV
jgi:hypothetical protein